MTHEEKCEVWKKLLSEIVYWKDVGVVVLNTKTSFGITEHIENWFHEMNYKYGE